MACVNGEDRRFGVRGRDLDGQPPVFGGELDRDVRAGGDADSEAVASDLPSEDTATELRTLDEGVEETREAGAFRAASAEEM